MWIKEEEEMFRQYRSYINSKWILEDLIYKKVCDFDFKGMIFIVLIQPGCECWCVVYMYNSAS